MTCSRAQEFLERKKLQAEETVDARKSAFGEKEALELAAQVDHIYASKGTKVRHLDLKKDKPSSQAVAELILGPTGNLRAPTLKRGRTLIVGFDESIYEKILTS